MSSVVHVATIADTLRFFSGQFEAIEQHGYQLTIVSSPGDYLSTLGTGNGRSTVALPIARSITPLRDVWSLVRLIQLFRQLRPALVHAHTPKAALLTLTAARFARVPRAIYHVHGSPLITAAGSLRELLTITERIACRFADVVVCVSHSVRDYYVSNKLCGKDKIRVLGAGSINGVDAAKEFNPYDSAEERAETRRRLLIDDGAFVIGYVGRLASDKGIKELVAAWGGLKDKHPGAVLMLVGGVDERDPVDSSVVEALQRDSRVRMAGFDWDVRKYYAAMDLFVLPSYREGFPVSVLEAAAMGLPVVTTTAIGCVDSVEPERTGLTVEVRNAHALERAIERYLVDPELRGSHGRAGRDRMLKEFRPERLWDATIRLYDDLLAHTTK